MRNGLRIFIAGMMMAFPAWAEAPTYALVKEKSTLKFFAIMNNAPVEGRFEQFTADIRFDPKQPDKSSIVAEVDTGSISASHGDVVKNLKLPEWLATEKFPKAVYKSAKISRMPNSQNYYVEGELTLRGVSMPVVLNFQLDTPSETRAIATGYATLHRKDYGVGQGEWAKDDVIKDEVRVEFRIVADKK